MILTRSAAAQRLAACFLVLFCLFMVAFAVVPATQDAAPAVKGTQGLERKLVEILQNAASAEQQVPAVVVSEREANAYLQNEGFANIPSGITDARVVFEESGRISMFATVDLAVVSASSTRGALDPLGYLTGSVPVTVAGFLHTNEGTGRLEVEEVTVAGLAVPYSVIRDIVREYSKSDVHPNGVELAEPFELPYRIREVQVGLAELVVEQ